MKRLILIVTGLLSTIYVSAQNDTIHFYSGEPLICRITEISETTVKYQFEGETLQNTVSLGKIESIHLSSGRVIEGKPRIDVTGPNGWENVIVTEGEYAVDGLKNHGEITIYGEQAATRPGMKYSDNRIKAINYATTDIKKKAASMGCHLVIIRRIDDVKFSPMVATWKGATAAAVNVTATIYSYE